MNKYAKGKHSTDLIAIADDILSKATGKSYRPSLRDMMNDYGLSEPQVQQVKRYVTEQASKQGLFWGYQPSLNVYRVAPSNAPDIAKEMYAYQGQQFANLVKGSRHRIEGAYGQGLIGRSAYINDTRLLSEIETGVAAFRDSVEG